MIAIEITESPDANVRTKFTFFKNDLYLGFKSGDLLITDPGLLASHLLIEVLENELLVHPQKGVDHYLLNGKRATTIRKLRAGNQLGVGSTVIRIVEFSTTPDLSKKTFLNQKLSRLIDQNDARLGVIEKLSAMMK